MISIKVVRCTDDKTQKIKENLEEFKKRFPFEIIAKEYAVYMKHIPHLEEVCTKYMRRNPIMQYDVFTAEEGNLIMIAVLIDYLYQPYPSYTSSSSTMKSMFLIELCNAGYNLIDGTMDTEALIKSTEQHIERTDLAYMQFTGVKTFIQILDEDEGD